MMPASESWGPSIITRALLSGMRQQGSESAGVL